MTHRHLPLALLLAALFIGLPGQSFATPMGTDAAASSEPRSNKDNDKLQEILKEIFTLGGLFDTGRSRDRSRNPRKSSRDADEIVGSEQWAEALAGEVFRLPIIYPEDPIKGDHDLATPVPEPTGALLFGMGILAVAGRRARSKRLR